MPSTSQCRLSHLQILQSNFLLNDHDPPPFRALRKKQSLLVGSCFHHVVSGLLAIGVIGPSGQQTPVFHRTRISANATTTRLSQKPIIKNILSATRQTVLVDGIRSYCRTASWKWDRKSGLSHLWLQSMLFKHSQ